MKNKIKILIVLMFGLAISCNDAIDIQQPGLLLPENAFQNVDDLQLGLLNLYNQFDNTVDVRFNAIYTDEISIGLVNGGQGLNEYALNLNPTSGTAASIWTTNYIALANINRLIAASANITPADAQEQDKYNSILGQSYALRAYAHFQLETYFTTDYTDDNALGVVALDYVPELNAQLPRNTNGEVFALIQSDLTQADALLVNVDDSDPTFINRDFITALRARMAAYREDYSSANTYASELLTKYPISDQLQFYNMFDDTDDTEIIFKLERSIGDSYDAQANDGFGWIGSLFAFSNSTYDGGPFFEMNRGLFNIIDQSDVRFFRYIDPTSLIAPDYETTDDYKQNDVLVISKYPGSDGQPLMNDLKIFRSSEMLLIKAEALADAGDYPGTAALIKQLRDARLGIPQPLPTYANETEAFGAILDERRVELAYEGHRWVDLKRLGVRGNRAIDRYSRDCEANGVCTISSSDYRFTLPIPLGEIDVDPLLEQNTGY